jgi:geranylgeranyl transferase type-2 subunit beta
VASLQREDGSFAGDEFGEIDNRFAYCAIACIRLLGSKVEPFLRAAIFRSARRFIEECRNFDGGFGAVPGAESHGGNVFCCIAALHLMDKSSGNAEKSDALASAEQEKTAGDVKQNDTLDSPAECERLLEWLVWRQVTGDEGCGLNGRPEKSPDVCYSWWILSAMRLLMQTEGKKPQPLPISQEGLLAFILASQDPVQGGIADRPGDRGDIFHTLFGVAGLAFLEYPGVAAVDESLCLPVCCLVGEDGVHLAEPLPL